MTLNIEAAAVYDRLAAELLELSKCALSQAAAIRRDRGDFPDVVEPTVIVNDLRSCLDVAKGARAMLQIYKTYCPRQ